MGDGSVQITLQKLSRVPRHSPPHRPEISAPSRAAVEAETGEDVLTSRFSCGGRGEVLAALKQRCHSAPCRKEVPVQQLQAGTSRDALGHTSQEHWVGAGPNTGCHGDTGNIVAAAMTAMVPLVKMESQVSQLVEDVQKLLQANRKGKEHGWSPQQHLQMLQRHQLELQSQLLQSAVTIVTGHAHLQSSQREAAVPSVAVETSPVTMETRHSNQRQEWDRATPTSPSQCSLSNQMQEVNRRSNELLREMRLLRAHVRTLMEPPGGTSSTGSAPPESQLDLSHQYQSLQDRPVTKSRGVEVQKVPSLLEEAAQVLHQVRRQKKVLEENLDSVLRSMNAEQLKHQLEVLSANRDQNHQSRIRRTVNSWINVQLSQLQTDPFTQKANHAVTSQRQAGRSSAPSDRRRPMRAKSGTGSDAGGGVQRQMVKQHTGAEPQSAQGGASARRHLDGEAYLTRVYGRPPYQGLRLTLKKSPYLRLGSPATPTSRKPRPRLLESVRGVKLKSCKTQTTEAPPTSVALTPTWLPAPAIAPPLRPAPGPPFSSYYAMTSADPTQGTVSKAIPLGQPRMNPSGSHRPPAVMLSSTPPPAAMLVAMGDQPVDGQVVPHQVPPPVTSHSIIIKRSTEEEQQEEQESEEEQQQEEEEEPFLVIADVVQEEVYEEVKGAASPPPPVFYHSPVFPSSEHRDRLDPHTFIHWVEQQCISRMMSQMPRPPPYDSIQNVSPVQSDAEQQSTSSDIAAAAEGGAAEGGLPLVDSVLLCQLVKEVLSESVIRILGDREEPEPVEVEPERPNPMEPETMDPEPVEPGLEASGVHEEVTELPLLDAPRTAPPSCREATPPDTPPPPITAAEPVATPIPSSEPTPSPHQATPSFWGHGELPLDEEQPEVKEEEEEQEPPAADEPASPSISSSPSFSTSSSSVTADAAAGRHVSEGQLLSSINQPITGCSSSSSLQEQQDMHPDPPSEGQVKGHYLLMTNGLTDQSEAAWKWEEPEELSAGEVRGGAANLDSTANQTSLGQLSQPADRSKVTTPQGSSQISVTDPNVTVTSDLLTEQSMSPHLDDTHTAPQMLLLVDSSSAALQEEVQEEVQEEGDATSSSDSSDVF